MLEVDASTAAVQRLPVSSSNLASVGFDRERHLLEIEFVNGHVYQYLGVHPRVFAALLASDSPGSYFLSEVRDRYEHRLIR
jgi:hypothetical protein